MSFIGENDGIFWMNLSDWMMNYDTLSICRCFDDNSWGCITYYGEWSAKSNTTGGCRGNTTVANNPQL